MEGRHLDQHRRIEEHEREAEPAKEDDETSNQAFDSGGTFPAGLGDVGEDRRGEGRSDVEGRILCDRCSRSATSESVCLIVLLRPLVSAYDCGHRPCARIAFHITSHLVVFAIRPSCSHYLPHGYLYAITAYRWVRFVVLPVSYWGDACGMLLGRSVENTGFFPSCHAHAII